MNGKDRLRFSGPCFLDGTPLGITALSVAFGNHYAKIERDNLEFERAMLNLAAMTPHNLQDITIAFKKWCMTTPFPWQVALDYCIDRARKGKSLPWEVEGWLS